ncbi:hypothetical protein GF312_15510 [Candidatus Poribacteria bacterium]|nr:hypothetical protein [Candidatus Poribacteria bacterium]
MTESRKNNDPFKCSFCGQSQDEVERLVAGQDPGVFICNDCISLCSDLLKEDGVKPKKLIQATNAEVMDTARTIEIAAKRCLELDIKHVVVASTTGETAIKTAEAFMDQEVDVIAVTLHAGTWEKYGKPDPEKIKKAEELGVKFLTCTHALMGNVNNAIMEKFGGISWTDLIAYTYYTFSQGTKVAVEIAVMAADANLVPVDEEIISLAGSDTGADTALVIKPAYSTDFFSLEIKELVVKPR